MIFEMGDRRDDGDIRHHRRHRQKKQGEDGEFGDYLSSPQLSPIFMLALSGMCNSLISCMIS